MKAPTQTRALHASLTVDDRDALDALRRRIAQHAVLVKHTLSTWDEDDNGLSDSERQTLEDCLIELCTSIVADTVGLEAIMNTAATRTGA